MSSALTSLGLVAILSAVVTADDAAFRLHIHERTRVLREEAEMALGGRLQLTEREQLVDQIFMKYKFEETGHGFSHPKSFNFSHHYFSYKDNLPHSKLYRLIKHMPKGAALHVHDSALLGPNYLLEITYLPYLYICFIDSRIKLKFSQNLPKEACLTGWELVKHARKASGNATKFDRDLKKHFSIVCDSPELVYNDINVVWKRFQNVFTTIKPLIRFRPVWEKYLYDALKSFHDDNIMYLELRSTLPALYELDGINQTTNIETAQIYKKVMKKFIRDYPDFVGLKIIYAPRRSSESLVVENNLNNTRRLKREFPDLVIGFDFVGQEDLGRPLRDFLPLLVAAKDELQFFFHAGETNQSGTTSDENLIDALLLGSRRLGHAYALLKHPVLERLVREWRVGLEVNVISNHVLRLVADVRNHPLAQILARDLPVVLSSDDPGLWEAAPLSHDFYVAWVGVASRHAGLRMLKQLALNSLTYSALEAPERDAAHGRFVQRWDVFIERVINEYKLSSGGQM